MISSRTIMAALITGVAWYCHVHRELSLNPKHLAAICTELEMHDVFSTVSLLDRCAVLCRATNVCQTDRYVDACKGIACTEGVNLDCSQSRRPA